MKNLRVYRDRGFLAMTFLAVALSSAMLDAQNVTTWHNDNYRTGWQQNETTLTLSSVSNTAFGLLWQWGSPSSPLTGAVFAQPLAVAGVHTQISGCQPCDLVFIATEKDMLYAFKAGSNSQNAIWSVNLANWVNSNDNDTAVDCNNLPIGIQDFAPCYEGRVGQNIGHTGTPVVDVANNTLYVVGAVQDNVKRTIEYYIFAVDIRSGQVLNTLPTAIGGTVNGKSPMGSTGACTSTYPASGQINFDYDHIQRSALLLLSGVVYVAFAPGDGETKNGWIFGYTFSNGSFTQKSVFATTPYGTGGGIWESAAGPASDGTYIYVATGNGTNYDPTTGPPVDMGDTLLRINPHDINGNFTVADFYTPFDAFTYNGTGRCIPPARTRTSVQGGS